VGEVHPQRFLQIGLEASIAILDGQSTAAFTCATLRHAAPPKALFLDIESSKCGERCGLPDANRLARAVALRSDSFLCYRVLTKTL